MVGHSRQREIHEGMEVNVSLVNLWGSLEPASLSLGNVRGGFKS